MKNKEEQELFTIKNYQDLDVILNKHPIMYDALMEMIMNLNNTRKKEEIDYWSKLISLYEKQTEGKNVFKRRW